MSTIWEMAARIRAEEALAAAAPARHGDLRVVALKAPGEVAYWCRYFGTTPMNLCCAIARVGHDPAALRRYFETRPRPRRRSR